MSRMAKADFDVAVIGAGAAGMMAAAVAGQRGLRVVLIDHAQRLAEKIRISGGGRCNFTNVGTGPSNFLSQNPNFCRSALAAYTPRDFIDLVEKHGIAWHEKHRGQLFCDDSSEAIIAMLKRECELGRVSWRMPCKVDEIVHEGGQFTLQTDQGVLQASQLVLATGGMAIPQLGATDFALGIARQFGLKVVEPRPALVPLTFDAQTWQAFSVLSGVALEVVVKAAAQVSGTGQAGKRAGKPHRQEFLEDLLFTHRGLSGPAILQISSYWNPGDAIQINLAPQQDLERELLAAKQGGRQQLATVLAGLWPKRLAEQWLAQADAVEAGLAVRRLADVPDRLLRQLAAQIHGWSLVPSGSAGYKKAEVMRGGVDTRGIDQKTMQAKAVPGLYFVGEALDVTGWLGGYNFQWAWASGVACGRALLAG
ncbi:NAD(P)/FAD-dependent oxidoreductase [Pollutimonas harenae]|uniref:NAD(P)/FAD-dependent oxidoreductase n=1 Tax=Pollutimonas harenae TaxID=657015 RepID=A0A853GXP6_9BURK|nr:NAD(P)/FAD-dependent oxidoreductase [Pollutimonas harenae]NYT86917.1 NAD(P)/FAD-dependent oxidoreductase [Pollutimonas harenae]TEA69370.1 NAD(P)/FAD-dependent oxidoreductase [Pollutimonas harenae]